MFTDSGESVVMRGKYYYFFVANTKKTEITLGATEFDDLKWLNFDEAYKLIKETNTGGRLRMITNILHILKDRGLLSTNQPENHGPKPTTQPEKPRGSQLHPTPILGSGSDNRSGRLITSKPSTSILLDDPLANLLGNPRTSKPAN